MRRSQLQHEAIKSLSSLGRASSRRSRSALFATPAHVRAQQRRTFQWTGAIPTRAIATQRVRPSEVQRNDLWEEEQLDATEDGPVSFEEVDSWGDDNAETMPEHLTIERVEPYATLEESKAAVRAALLARLPSEDLLHVVLRASRTEGYLATVKPPLLKTIVDLIKPQERLTAFRDVYGKLHPNVVRSAGGRSLESVFESYTRFIRLILDNPSKDKTLERLRLRTLLQLAGTIGDASGARTIFKIMKQEEMVKPDVHMYNNYISAVCWHGAWTVARMRLRAHAWDLKMREELQTSPRWQGYRIREGGVKEEVLGIIKQMQQDGVECNADTWSSLIIALAREGDKAGIAATLKRVWDIDVGAVMRRDERGMLFENQLMPESPLFPTANALQSIAHAFCINSELTGGLQVIDFIARKYDISIPPSAWKELLEWAYVLSTRRHGRGEEEESKKTGAVPASVVGNIWTTMRAPPYNMKPDLHLYLLSCLAALRQRKLLQAVQIFLEANERALDRRFSRQNGSRVARAQSPLGTELQMAQDLKEMTTMSRMIRSLLSQAPWKRDQFAMRFSKVDGSFVRAWYGNIIPDLLHKCRWLEKRYGFAYSIPTGRLQFNPWGEWKVAPTRVEQADTSLVVYQTSAIVKEDSYLGSSRQERLQIRYARKGARGDRPVYQPQWFETDKVKDWRPHASVIDA